MKKITILIIWGFFLVFSCQTQSEQSQPIPPEIKITLGEESEESGKVEVKPEKPSPEPEKQKPAEEEKAPPLPEKKEIKPSPAEKPSPQTPGLKTTESLIQLMDKELKSFGGWRANDLLFGRIFHNRKYEQLGVLEVIRHSVRVLKSEIARAGVTDQFDPDLALAEADFWNDPSKFWFPSAESKFREGVSALKRYRSRLENGEARFYPRSDNLYQLLSEYARILGDVHYQLIRQDVGWFEIDNWFFYARGVARAMEQVYLAILEDFSEEIKNRKLEKLFQEAIADFHQASRLNPLMVLNGDPDDLRANHRLNLASFISDAMGKTITIMETIRK